MSKLWTKAGKLVTNSAGTKLCYQDTCPCAAADCSSCSGFATPAYIDLTFSGWAANVPLGGGCTSCTDFNSGAFRATQVSGSPCTWRYTFSPSKCYIDKFEVTIGTNAWIVRAIGIGGIYYRWTIPWPVVGGVTQKCGVGSVISEDTINYPDPAGGPYCNYSGTPPSQIYNITCTATPGP